MAGRKKKRGGSLMGRSDIPYAQRLRIDQVAHIAAARDTAAKVTMFCHCIALHELHGIGYKRLVSGLGEML